MAIRKYCGFELMDSTAAKNSKLFTVCRRNGFGAISLAPSMVTVSDVNPRNALGKCLLDTAGGCEIRDGIGASLGTMILSFGYYLTDNTVTDVNIAEFFDGTTIQCYIRVLNRTVKAYRGNGTLLGTASTEVSQSTWHWIEIKVVFHGTTGSIVMRVDEQVILSLTGINTITSTTAGADGWAIGGQRNGALSDSNPVGVTLQQWDDLIVMDTTGTYCNDFIGDRKVSEFSPTADGYYTQFTPLSGTDHFEMVNEVPPDDDTTYNSSQTVGDKDTFTFGTPLTNPNTTIAAVGCTAYARCIDGGGHTFVGICRSSGVDGVGSVVPVPSSYNWLESLIYVDPNTGYPFTRSAVNAAEFGYKINS